MRSVTGAILVLAGEQAFAHAHLISFPQQIYARTILLPFSAAALLAGVAFLVFGFFRDQKPS